MFRILMFLLLCSTTLAADFREASWGMSPGEVKKLEPGQPIEDLSRAMGAIGYEGSIAGHSAQILFGFLNGKLTSGLYLFTEVHTNPQTYVTDFYALKQLLTEKYGEPTKYAPIWSNALYQDDPEHFGLAISAGHVQVFGQWVTERTIVSLLMSGDNFKVTIRINYQCVAELKQTEEAARQNLGKGL